MIPEQASNISEQMSVVSMASDFVDRPLGGSKRRSSHPDGTSAWDSDEHVRVEPCPDSRSRQSEDMSGFRDLYALRPGRDPVMDAKEATSTRCIALLLCEPFELDQVIDSLSC
jgi:hypothetical protein